MAWTLPGHINNPVLQKKAILETSYAFSRTLNPRNVEFSWYPLWGQTLCDLVADVPDLIVAAQFPVWVVHEDNDAQEAQDDGDNPEEVEEEEVAKVVVVKDQREQHAVGIVVDFAILSLTAVPEAREKLRYGGWRITTVNVGLLVEVKRSWNGKFGDIAEAREDLIEQAGYLFLKDANKTSVMAIAAAGPYWSGTTINCADIERTIHRLSAKDPSYQPPGKESQDRLPRWNKILCIDGASSTARLRTVYMKLRD
ncbi:hypothetical protein EV702DRAFT_1282455 [Suillus placidus]|uniref:Uncharacterized protein n=1 Tax=Suillus placidus TaxID=48579 RepID=A0A9P7CXD4_9AGAM|nr:hypothetical protein EV702DRAFT_1282455 [Suillus placidus]